MAETSPLSAFQKFKNFLGDVSLLHWLWQLAVAFYAAWKGGTLMPAGISQPGLWAASGAIFCGTLATTATAVNIATWGIPKVKRWCSPHYLTVIEHSGDSIYIVFNHFGAPAIWTVDARIVSLHNQSTSPSPIERRCYLIKDNKRARALRLCQGEFAYISLASIRGSEWDSHTWVTIDYADTSSPIPNSGAVVELIIRADPPMKTGDLRRQFSISRKTGIIRYPEGGYKNVDELEVVTISGS